MKNLLIILLLIVSVSAFSQTKNTTGAIKEHSIEEIIPSLKKDSTITVKPNALQLERLQTIEKQIQELQTALQDNLQLILGIRKEDIEKLEFKDGSFVVVIKRK